MGREWKPGDVAVNVAHGYRGMFVDARHSCSHHRGEAHWHNQSGYADSAIDIRRPLVVIDPEDREQVSCLVSALRAISWTANTGFSDTRAALRSLVAPAKPSEPTGLGAVVEDADGGQWIRYGHGPVPWMYAASSPDNRDPYPWDQIAAVKVLSEGVTA